MYESRSVDITILHQQMMTCLFLRSWCPRCLQTYGDPMQHATYHTLVIY
jgi:hypothetical protein